ncbi:uncharacterized protein [Macrobrachium rosenbergii]|uniref:uncharacterized protein n=1 Tax=Macrobrachium rosenbergii TaxID=79674 RepID=UPI0034D5CD10
MNSGKENWLMTRKPVFATRSFKSDTLPLQPNNALGLESQRDKVTYFLRSSVYSVKELENQNSFSSKKVEEYYSPTVLSERDQRGHHGTFHSSGQRLSRKEKASNNSYQSEYTWKEPPAQQIASCSTGNGSAKKPGFTLGRPPMLSRGLSRQPQKQNLVTKSTSKEYDADGDSSGSDCNRGSLQECRLALCFDDVQESQENEDLIAPLRMMASSAALPNGMVRQDSSPEQKKNLLQGGSRSRGMNGTDNVIVKDKANVRRGLDSYFRSTECNIQKKDEHKKSSASPKVVLPLITISQSEVTSQKTLVGRANVKRRSCIPLTKNIPKYKVKDKLSYSASKVTKFSENKHYQVKSVKKIQKAGIPASSKKKSRLSALLDGPKVAVAPPEPVTTEEKHKPVELCDSSTNTGIMFSFGKSPDKGLVKEVEMLMEEQEEITRKAQLILDETSERRSKIKSTNLLESFKTSVSPLRRICGLIQEKTSFLDVSSGASESVKVTEMETHACAPCDDKSSCFENSSIDISVDSSLQDESLGCSILNNTDDFTSKAVKWKHLKLNSRVFQSPTCYSKPAEKGASRVTDEDKFIAIDKDISPFTEIAGCIERPSLAPMTPHTHHQVSMIKLSLRKQLNQLYES